MLPKRRVALVIINHANFENQNLLIQWLFSYKNKLFLHFVIYTNQQF